MLRRRGLYGIVALLVGTGIGVFGGTQVSTMYSSSTGVLVTPTGLPTSNSGVSLARTETPLNLETESQVMLSQPVAIAAAKLAGDTRPLPELLKAVSINVPANTTVLTVTAEDEVSAKAQKLSRAFAQAYLDNRNATAQASVDTDVVALEKQLKSLDKQLTKVIGPIASLPADSADRTYAEAQERILVDQISSTSDVMNSLTSTQISGGSILSDASTPVGPALPMRLLATVAGVLLGLLSGGVLMFLLERRGRLIRRPQDVEAFAQIPVIGRPTTHGRRSSNGARGMLDDWMALRHDLEARLPDGNATMLVVPVGTSIVSAYAAANLAASFGRTGTVAVICGDLDNSLLAEILGVTSETGLVQALARDRTELPELSPSPTQPGVWVLPAGDVSGDIRGLLNGRRFAELVRQLKDEYDLVIVQALPSDAMALARFCDGTLLMVETGKSRYDDVAAVADALRRLGASILGAALFDREALTAQAKAAATADEALRSPIKPVPEPTPPPGSEGAAGTEAAIASNPLIRSVGK